MYSSHLVLIILAGTVFLAASRAENLFDDERAEPSSTDTTVSIRIDFWTYSNLWDMILQSILTLSVHTQVFKQVRWICNEENLKFMQGRSPWGGRGGAPTQCWRKTITSWQIWNSSCKSLIGKIEMKLVNNSKSKRNQIIVYLLSNCCYYML